MKKERKAWEDKEEKIIERKKETLEREKKVEKRKKKLRGKKKENLRRRNRGRESWEKERKKIVEYDDDEIKQERECFNFNSCLSFFFVLLHHSFSLVLFEEKNSKRMRARKRREKEG